MYSTRRIEAIESTACEAVVKDSKGFTKLVNPLKQMPEYALASTRTAVLGAWITLLVRMGSSTTPLPLANARRTVLGRFDYESDTRPDVDLTAFGAHQLGVSRLHAAIESISGVLTLTDLDSRNGTFLNGQRLTARKSYILNHRDVICLGKLVVYLSI